MDNPTDMFQWFASLGVGGILAGIIFYYARKDSLAHLHIWKDTAIQVIQVVKDNTIALTTLAHKLEREHIERSTRYDDTDPRRIMQLEMEISRLKKMQNERQ